MEDGGEGKIRYDGGSTKCMLARDGMGGGGEWCRKLLVMVFKWRGCGIV